MSKEHETASAEAEARGQAIEARARALAEMWIAEVVSDDAPSEETDADHCARMLVDQALNRFDGIAEKVAQRIRDGASLGSDAAFKALVDDVVLGGGGALSGDEFAVVKAMVTCKLTDGRRHE